MLGNEQGLVLSACVAMIVSIIGCGGSALDDGNSSPSSGPSPSATPSGEPVDIADYRNVVPDGQYRVTVIAASCDVNETYRSEQPVLVARSRAGQEPGINIPLPWVLRGEDGAPLMGPARQQLNLTTRSLEFTHAQPGLCTGGNVRRALHVEDLAATSMTISFESEGIGCQESFPLCTVEARFDLVERSCDASCDPIQVDHQFQADGTVTSTCACTNKP